MADEQDLCVWLKSRTPFDEAIMQRVVKSHDHNIIENILGYPMRITSKKKFLAVLWILKYHSETNWFTAQQAVAACKNKPDYMPFVVQAVSARLGVQPKEWRDYNTTYFLARMFENGGAIAVDHAMDICITHEGPEMREMAREYLVQFDVHIPAELSEEPVPDFPDVDI